MEVKFKDERPRKLNVFIENKWSIFEEDYKLIVNLRDCMQDITLNSEKIFNILDRYIDDNREELLKNSK